MIFLRLITNLYCEKHDQKAKAWPKRPFQPRRPSLASLEPSPDRARIVSRQSESPGEVPRCEEANGSENLSELSVGVELS